MKIDKEKITGLQFMCSVTCFIQASALLTAFLTGVTKQESWMVSLFGMVVCVPIIYLFRTIMVMFPDQNLMQILETVFGRVAGKILGIGYVWFFITLCSLNLMDMGDFVKLTIMTETPNVVLAFMCLIVSALAVRYGIRVVARYSMLFVTVATFIIVSSVFMVLNQFEIQNLLPVFDMPVKKYIQGTHIIMTIPIGELVAFLMIIPNIKLSGRDVSKYLFAGFAIGGITLLVVLIRDIAVLGNTITMFTLPSLVALRLVNLGTTLSRMEILFAIVLIMLLFFKITFLYYISVVSISYLVNLKDYRNIVLSVGALVIAYGLTLYPCSVKHAASAQEIVPTAWTSFEIIIPLLTLVVAKLRGLQKPKGVS